MIASSGIISAHNLHTAGFSEEDRGKKEAAIAHPRKKTINFIMLTLIFFITISFSNVDSRDCIEQRTEPIQTAF